MTLFLMPTVYFIINKHSDERIARAEARRERIAAGLTRKEAQATALETEAETVPEKHSAEQTGEHSYDEEPSL
jgi:HAE1 family hydrophobic/amphiphilic exporter-1